MHFVKLAFRREAIVSHNVLSSLIPNSLWVKEKVLIYLPVNESRCSPTVLSLLDPPHFLFTALVISFIIFLIASSSKSFVGFFFYYTRFLKHLPNLLMQQLPSISRSITILLQKLRFFNTEKCKESSKSNLEKGRLQEIYSKLLFKSKSISSWCKCKTWSRYYWSYYNSQLEKLKYKREK